MKTYLFPFWLCLLLCSCLSIAPFGQKTSKKMKKDYLVHLKTPEGDITLLLYEDTPIHRENFLKLAREGFLDSTRFHRVIRDFMIQGGDPNSKPGGDETMIGRGGPGYTLEAEILPHHIHKKGALAAARQGDQVNPERRSSGSQFYIVHNPNNCRHLDGSYTVFGEVIDGLDVVDRIAEKPVQMRTNMPHDPLPITVSVEEMKKKQITETYGYAYAEEEEEG